jgi:hypothetical protein
MANEPLLLHPHRDLARKFRRVVPDRQRIAIFRSLLEKALESNTDDDNDPLSKPRWLMNAAIDFPAVEVGVPAVLEL